MNSPLAPDETRPITEGKVEDLRTHNFRSLLSQFAYAGPPLRRSPRFGKCAAEIPLTAPKKEDSPSVRSRRKRRLSTSHSCGDNVAATPNNSPKKRRRGYAAPETYAHLQFLQDYLAEGLNVIFCGINPGYRSAEVGHHFANPTNHFWRCLHRSGFTSRLLDSSEDFTLSKDFQLGLTNLVDRPSVQQAELAPSEMVAAVPSLLAKILRFRPRIVCFVGLGIGRVFQQVLKSAPSFRTADVISTKPSTSRKARSSSTEVGLQPFKLVYSQRTDTDVTETLFFTVPSTSGRVVSHQLSDKVIIFTLLKKTVDDLTQGILDTNEMSIIPIQIISSISSSISTASS